MWNRQWCPVLVNNALKTGSESYSTLALVLMISCIWKNMVWEKENIQCDIFHIIANSWWNKILLFWNFQFLHILIKSIESLEKKSILFLCKPLKFAKSAATCQIRLACYFLPTILRLDAEFLRSINFQIWSKQMNIIFTETQTVPSSA